MNKEYVIVKEKEKQKYLPSDICKKMNENGFKKFSIYRHSQLWKSENAKNPTKSYGVQVAKTWYWYNSWLVFVEKHCQQNKTKYQTN